MTADDTLRAQAEGAAQGEWYHNSYSGIYSNGVTPDPEQIAGVVDFDGPDHKGDVLFGPKAVATRDHIAAWSPPRALAALDVVAAARKFHAQYLEERELTPDLERCGLCVELARWDAFGNKGTSSTVAASTLLRVPTIGDFIKTVVSLCAILAFGALVIRLLAMLWGPL